MSYKSVPTLCPVCDGKRTDAASVATHNVKAASDGCRVYVRLIWRRL